jgi:hypothetical protein
MPAHSAQERLARSAPRCTDSREVFPSRNAEAADFVKGVAIHGVPNLPGETYHPGPPARDWLPVSIAKKYAQNLRDMRQICAHYAQKVRLCAYMRILDFWQ